GLRPGQVGHDLRLSRAPARAGAGDRGGGAGEHPAAPQAHDGQGLAEDGPPYGIRTLRDRGLARHLRRAPREALASDRAQPLRMEEPMTGFFFRLVITALGLWAAATIIPGVQIAGVGNLIHGASTRLMDRPVAAARLTPRERRTLVVLGVLYAAVVIPIGIRKGGDFTQELGQSERLLRGLPLYSANPEGGIWWPPFTALGLAPFALVARWSLALAKACWAVLNVGCLGCSLALARRWTTGWLPLVLAVAAVGKPLQSNFEHLNLTPLL